MLPIEHGENVNHAMIRSNANLNVQDSNVDSHNVNIGVDKLTNNYQENGESSSSLYAKFLDICRDSKDFFGITSRRIESDINSNTHTANDEQSRFNTKTSNSNSHLPLLKKIVQGYPSLNSYFRSQASEQADTSENDVNLPKNIIERKRDGSLPPLNALNDSYSINAFTDKYIDDMNLGEYIHLLKNDEVSDFNTSRIANCIYRLTEHSEPIIDALRSKNNIGDYSLAFIARFLNQKGRDQLLNDHRIGNLTSFVLTGSYHMNTERSATNPEDIVEHPNAQDYALSQAIEFANEDLLVKALKHRNASSITFSKALGLETIHSFSNKTVSRKIIDSKVALLIASSKSAQRHILKSIVNSVQDNDKKIIYALVSNGNIDLHDAIKLLDTFNHFDRMEVIGNEEANPMVLTLLVSRIKRVAHDFHISDEDREEIDALVKHAKLGNMDLNRLIGICLPNLRLKIAAHTNSLDTPTLSTLAKDSSPEECEVIFNNKNVNNSAKYKLLNNANTPLKIQVAIKRSLEHESLS